MATGKAYCLSRFADLGVPVLDASVIAREAVEPGSAGLQAVVKRFGSRILDPPGALNRSALAHIVFGDDAARRDLEAILHPIVYLRIEGWFAALSAPFGI